MRVLLITNDLMARSQIEGAVRRADGELIVASSAANLPAEETLAAIDYVVIDLSTLDGAVTEVVKRIRSASSAKIAAFAPHVHEARLASASEAGCDEVVSRGQIEARVSQLMRSN